MSTQSFGTHIYHFRSVYCWSGFCFGVNFLTYNIKGATTDIYMGTCSIRLYLASKILQQTAVSALQTPSSRTPSRVLDASGFRLLEPKPVCKRPPQDFAPKLSLQSPILEGFREFCPETSECKLYTKPTFYSGCYTACCWLRREASKHY